MFNFTATKIGIDSIEKMMLENDVAGIASVLEEAHYVVHFEDEVEVFFANRGELPALILGYAVVLAEKEALSDEMLAELIARLGREIDTMKLIRMIQILSDHVERPEEYKRIPDWIRESLRADEPEYDPSVDAFIVERGNEDFGIIIDYLVSGEPKRFDLRYSPMIIHGFWRRGLVSKRRIVTLMAIFMRRREIDIESLLHHPLAAAMIFGGMPIFL